MTVESVVVLLVRLKSKTRRLRRSRIRIAAYATHSHNHVLELTITAETDHSVEVLCVDKVLDSKHQRPTSSSAVVGFRRG